MSAGAAPSISHVWVPAPVRGPGLPAPRGSYLFSTESARLGSYLSRLSDPDPPEHKVPAVETADGVVATSEERARRSFDRHVIVRAPHEDAAHERRAIRRVHDRKR